MFCYGIEESEVPDMKICELDCEMLDQWVARSLGIDLEFLGKPFMPSTLWEHGGPIIEGAGISLLSTKVSPCNDWQAGMGHPDLGQGGGTYPSGSRHALLPGVAIRRRTARFGRRRGTTGA